MNETTYMILMALTMAGVTYIIRMVPMVFFKGEIKSKFIKSFLYYVPFAVLTAMTFPSVFFATGNVYSSTIGTCVAFIGALSKKSLITVAIISVVAILTFELIVFII